MACIGDYKRKEEELLGIGLQPANIPYPGLLVEKEKLDIEPGLLDIQPPGLLVLHSYVKHESALPKMI